MLFSLPLLFTVGGLAITWRDVRATFLTIGAAGVFFCGAASFFAKEENGRADMDSASTTIGNSNDLASQLLLVLPFLLFIAMDRQRSPVLRWSMIVPMTYGLLMILKTESRGAVIALVVSFLYVLLRTSAKQRIAALAIALMLMVSVAVFFRGNSLARLATMFGSDKTVSADVRAEAKESADARTYLLKQSLIYTLQHPIFGVGPGQFQNFEGQSARLEGRVGNWHATHNSFTQISSECGVPALIFFVLGLGGAFVSVSRLYSKARRGGYTEIANASFCYLVSMVGFLTSIVFLANAYRFYLPAMIGLAIALCAAAEKEMARAEAGTRERRNDLVPGRAPRLALS
jgi:O-antigen ligase